MRPPTWAGPLSLAVPYDFTVLRPGSDRSGTLVRLSMGLEDVQDLQDDLAQALQQVFGG